VVPFVVPSDVPFDVPFDVCGVPVPRFAGTEGRWGKPV
jgi:hypothetical protein